MENMAMSSYCVHRGVHMTRTVAFERTYLQGLTHSRRWDIWIDVHVVLSDFNHKWEDNRNEDEVFQIFVTKGS